MNTIPSNQLWVEAEITGDMFDSLPWAPRRSGDDRTGYCQGQTMFATKFGDWLKSNRSRAEGARTEICDTTSCTTRGVKIVTSKHIIFAQAVFNLNPDKKDLVFYSEIQIIVLPRGVNEFR